MAAVKKTKKSGGLLPPPDFSTKILPIKIVNGIFYRMHKTSDPPMAYSWAKIHRFNAPNSEYGVLYIGKTIGCTFVEVYGKYINKDGGSVTKSELAKNEISRIALNKKFKIVDLTGPGLMQIGADSQVPSTMNYKNVSQKWGLAIWKHPKKVDGIMWLARHDPSEISLAFFDRSKIIDHTNITSVGSLMHPSNRDILRDLIVKYKIKLL